jgi:hypothetical protein
VQKKTPIENTKVEMDSPATESSSKRQAFKLLGEKILYCFVIFTRNILIRCK